MSLSGLGYSPARRSAASTSGAVAWNWLAFRSPVARIDDETVEAPDDAAASYGADTRGQHQLGAIAFSWAWGGIVFASG